MNYMSNIRCPFYVTRSTRDKKMATITCEKIEKNLGFDAKNQLLFRNHAEKEDYVGLFCRDRYQECPYYKGIYHYLEGEKKT